jgi:hypothetical protein
VVPSRPRRIKRAIVNVVNLTNVKKKTREWKSALLEKVRSLCEKYDSVYVIKYYNMRNDRLKELREVCLPFVSSLLVLLCKGT